MTVRIDNNPAVCSPPANTVADLGIADLACKVSRPVPFAVSVAADPSTDDSPFVLKFQAPGSDELVRVHERGAKRAADLKARAESLAKQNRGYTYKVTRADSTRGVHTFKFSAASK